MQIIIQIALVRLLLRTRPLTKLQSILPTSERMGHCVDKGSEENGKIRCAAARRADVHMQVRAAISRYMFISRGKEHRLDIDKKFPAKTRFRQSIIAGRKNTKKLR